MKSLLKRWSLRLTLRTAWAEVWWNLSRSPLCVYVCIYNTYIGRIRIYEWCKMSRETFVLKVFLFHFFPLSCHSWSENLNLSLSLSLMKIIFGYIIYPRLVLIHNNHCDDILIWCVHIFINFAMFFFFYIYFLFCVRDLEIVTTTGQW